MRSPQHLKRQSLFSGSPATAGAPASLSASIVPRRAGVWRRFEAFVRSDVKGAVSSEYVVLVGTVGLAVAFAVVTIGPRLVQSFERSRNILVSPFP